MNKTITTSLSPNTDMPQVMKALAWLVTPWKWPAWKRGRQVAKIEDSIASYIGAQYATAFINGRTALYALLNAYGIGKDDEVAVQAYTCVVVPNSITATGAKPLFVDIDATYNIDPVDLQRKITPQTKAIIIQHTFGTPANIAKITKIAKENNCIIIEDCAHSLGAEYQEKKVGSFGDSAFYSFGRDKVISSVSGGMATTNNEQVAKKLQSMQQEASNLSFLQIKKHLLYIPLFSIIKKTYSTLSIGKAIAALSKKCNITPLVITKEEKKGNAEKTIYKLPNALADLALQQFSRLEEKNSDRVKKAQYYSEKLTSLENIEIPVITGEKEIMMRYTVQVPDAKKAMECGKKHNIFFGDWYTSVIAPDDIHLPGTQYQKGMCPKAEQAAKKTINLPNHHKITIEDQDKIIEVLDKCINND